MTLKNPKDFLNFTPDYRKYLQPEITPAELEELFTGLTDQPGLPADGWTLGIRDLAEINRMIRANNLIKMRLCPQMVKDILDKAEADMNITPITSLSGTVDDFLFTKKGGVCQSFFDRPPGACIIILLRFQPP
jgi:hypothetical protein